MLRTRFNLKKWRRPFWKRHGQNSRSLGTAVLLQPPDFEVGFRGVVGGGFPEENEEKAGGGGEGGG